MDFLSLNNKEISLRAEDGNAIILSMCKWVKKRFWIILNAIFLIRFFPLSVWKIKKIVGFALTGRNGSSFYDIATAVLKDYRQKGIATTLMSKAFDKISKEKGQYILECLSINDKALSLYQNAGFKINRSLTVYKIQDDRSR